MTELIERKKMEKIISKIDTEEVVENVLDVALAYLGCSGYAYADLSFTTGNIYYGWTQLNSYRVGDTLATLCTYSSYGSGDEEFEDADILDGDEYEELERLARGDEDEGIEPMDYNEAYRYIVEKYNIDIDKRIRDYYMDYVAERVDVIKPDSKFLDSIYKNEE